MTDIHWYTTGYNSGCLDQILIAAATEYVSQMVPPSLLELGNMCCESVQSLGLVLIRSRTLCKRRVRLLNKMCCPKKR